MNHHCTRSLWASLFVSLVAWCTEGALAADHSFLRSLPAPTHEQEHASVGEGEYAYRFVVRHPQDIAQPWPRAPYQISLRDGVTWEGGPAVYQGLTDAHGRTTILRSRLPIAASDWVVLPIWGAGQQGRAFRLVDHNQQGVVDYPYLIDAAQGPIYCGHSLPGGHTARVQTVQPSNLRLYTSVDVDECHKLSAALNPVMVNPDPRKQIWSLERLLEQGWSTPLRERLQNKLMEALQVHGDEAEIRERVARWVAEPGISHQTLADRLNSAGYGLLAQQRLPKLAESLLAQGLTLHPSPAILDSHAWALHTLGRNEEALVKLDLAAEGFLQSCKEDEESMYQETLAHRAQVLAALGRKQAALDAWVMVYRMDRQASWAASVKDWSNIKVDIEAEAQRREKAGEPIPLSCSDTRDQRFLSGELTIPAALKSKIQ